jgi:hypothetical protein
MAEQRMSGGQLAAIIFAGWVATVVLRFLVRSLFPDAERLAAGVHVGLWISWIVISVVLIQRWIKTAPTVPPANR